jgi:4-carboxymuconolactone decarboxylase
MARMDYPDTALPEVQEVIARLPVPLNLARMAAHAPVLAGSVLDLGVTILSRLSLPARRRELVILLVARHTGCAYEWAQHVPIALAAGVSETEIAAIAVGAESWSDPADQALAAAVADLLHHDSVTETVWRRVAAVLPPDEIVEACLVAGYYRMLAGFLNAFQIDVDPQGEGVVDLATTRPDGR